MFESMDASYQIAEEELTKGKKFEDQNIKDRMLGRLEITEDSMKSAINMIQYSDELYYVLLKHQLANKTQDLPVRGRSVYYTNMDDPVGEMPEEKAVDFHIHMDRIYSRTEKYSGNMVCINPNIFCIVSNMLSFRCWLTTSSRRSSTRLVLRRCG